MASLKHLLPVRLGGFSGRSTNHVDHHGGTLRPCTRSPDGLLCGKGEPERNNDEYEDTDVSDLIADLLHLQKNLNLRDINKTLATALMHFEAEQEEHGQPPKTEAQKEFTTKDADRLLGLADQFLEDWKDNEGKNDPECAARRAEWGAIRPQLASAPKLLNALRQAVTALNAKPRFPVPEFLTDSYKVAALCDEAIAEASGSAA